MADEYDYLDDYNENDPTQFSSKVKKSGNKDNDSRNAHNSNSQGQKSDNKFNIKTNITQKPASVVFNSGQKQDPNNDRASKRNDNNHAHPDEDDYIQENFESISPEKGNKAEKYVEHSRNSSVSKHSMITDISIGGRPVQKKRKKSPRQKVSQSVESEIPVGNYDRVKDLIDSDEEGKSEKQIEVENQKMRKQLKDLNEQLTTILNKQDIAGMVKKSNQPKPKSYMDKIRLINQEIINNEKMAAQQEEECQRLQNRVDKAKDASYVVDIQTRLDKIKDQVEEAKKVNKKLELENGNSGKNLKNMDQENVMSDQLIEINAKSKEIHMLKKKIEKLAQDNTLHEQKKEEMQRKAEELNTKFNKLHVIGDSHGIEQKQSPFLPQYTVLSKKVFTLEEQIKLTLNKNNKYLNTQVKRTLDDMKIVNERDGQINARLDEMVREQSDTIKDLLDRESLRSDRSMREMITKLKLSLDDSRERTPKSTDGSLGGELIPKSAQDLRGRQFSKPPLPSSSHKNAPGRASHDRAKEADLHTNKLRKKDIFFSEKRQEDSDLNQDSSIEAKPSLESRNIPSAQSLAKPNFRVRNTTKITELTEENKESKRDLITHHSETHLKGSEKENVDDSQTPKNLTPVPNSNQQREKSPESNKKDVLVLGENKNAATRQSLNLKSTESGDKPSLVPKISESTSTTNKNEPLKLSKVSQKDESVKNSIDLKPSLELPNDGAENSRLNRKRINPDNSVTVTSGAKPENIQVNPETKTNKDSKPLDPFAKFDNVNPGDLVKKDKKKLFEDIPATKQNEIPEVKALPQGESKDKKKFKWDDSPEKPKDKDTIPEIGGNSTKKFPSVKESNDDFSNPIDLDGSSKLKKKKKPELGDDDLHSIQKYDDPNKTKPFDSSRTPEPAATNNTGLLLKKKDPEAQKRREQETKDKQKDLAKKAEQAGNAFFEDFDV